MARLRPGEFHRLSLSISNGRAVAVCRCGTNLGKFEDSIIGSKFVGATEKARHAYSRHEEAMKEVLENAV